MDTTKRRYDLDWLRVLAILLVFVYHTTRFFNLSDWHIKNAETSMLVEVGTTLFDAWGMPFLFLISGASLVFQVRPGRGGRLVWDRVKRLLVPLALGTLFLAPPQEYAEAVAHGRFQGSLLDFLPQAVGGWFSGLNFLRLGVHLWYLEALFLYTVALLPLFYALASPAGRRAVAGLAARSTRPGAIFLWALPAALVLMALDPLGVLIGEGGYLRVLAVYPLFVVYGFLIFSDRDLQLAIIRQRRAGLIATVVMGAALVALAVLIGEPGGIAAYVVAMCVVALYGWCAMVTVLGYGMRYLTGGSPLLTYANEGVLPFYVLHQPVILLIGYYVIPLSLPPAAKWLIIAPLAFAVTVAAYEYGVRRSVVLRVAFGLKPLKPAVPVAPARTELVT